MKTNVTAGSRNPPTFNRFIRSLDADGFSRSTLGVLLACLLLGAWVAWLFLARVTLYEVTDAARLEADQAGYSVESAVPGRVVATKLALGKEVKAGDVLATLDTDAQRLQLDEERTRLAAVAPQITTLDSEVDAEQRAISEAREAGRAALDEARARVEEADAGARFAEEEAKRLTALHAQGIIAELEALRAASEAKSRRAAADSLKFTVSRLERDQQTQETERRVRIEKLLRERSQLEGQRSTSAATIGRLQNEIEKRVIRAPATGQLGEVAASRAGAVVREGDKLGTVVPAGELRIIANFPPSAQGRIRVGQPARMRLNGFAWTQYGSLTASVSRVAGEIRDNQLRVELAINSVPPTGIPVQHGLPGMIEVEVERVTAVTLLLRAVGFLSKPPAPSQQQADAAGFRGAR